MLIIRLMPIAEPGSELETGDCPGTKHLPLREARVIRLPLCALSDRVVVTCPSVTSRVRPPGRPLPLQRIAS